MGLLFALERPMMLLEHIATYQGANPFADDAVLVMELRPAAGQVPGAEAMCKALRDAYPDWPVQPPDPSQAPMTRIALTLAQWAVAAMNAGQGYLQVAGAAPSATGALLWVGLHEATVSHAALQLALETILHADRMHERRDKLRSSLEWLWQMCRHHHPGNNSTVLMQAARNKGIPVLPFAHDRDTWQYGWGQRSRVFASSGPNENGSVGYQVARFKNASKSVFSALGLPVPAHCLVMKPSELERAARIVGWPCVTKPVDAGKGRGVTAGIRSLPELQAGFAHAQRNSQGPVMVEAFVAGDDHRLMVVDGRLLVTNCKRPPSVEGDGKRTVSELLDALNASRASDPEASRLLLQIEVDAALHQQLALQGVTLDSVPAAGRVITLRSIANVASGGILIDVTGKVHPQIRHAAEMISASMGLPVMGLDYITTDISKSWEEAGGGFIETNPKPGLGLKIDGHDPVWLGEQILGSIPGRIPLAVAVVPQADMFGVQHWLQQLEWPGGSGWICGTVGSVGGVPLRFTTESSWQAAQAVLRHRSVGIALIICGDQDLMRQGMHGGRADLVMLCDVELPVPWQEVLSRNAGQLDRLPQREGLAWLVDRVRAGSYTRPGPERPKPAIEPPVADPDSGDRAARSVTPPPVPGSRLQGKGGSFSDGDRSVGACFESIAARLPDKVAIEAEGRQVSYAELDRAAHAVARVLLAGDARPPARIALLFNDRIAAITAMLGVLKAGDAYVPLDADDPDERVRFILGDCAPFALVTNTALLERARMLCAEDCRLINIDEIGPGDLSMPLPEASPDALAYLFYTSGSTGRPKGVCHSHRSLLHFIGCYGRTIGIRADDRLSLLYSLSFSAANMDIYGGLLNGATVCAYDVRQGLAAIAEWMEQADITILHTVPTVFRYLAGGIEQSRRFERIRAVDLGGETVFASDVALFRRHFREDSRLINHLAATEAMVIAQHVVAHPAGHYEGVLPAGRSPEGVKLHIRRQDGSAADVGETGEIMVSSPYVSSGYWQRPELSAAAFSEDPGNPGWRIYRTGDLGRISADGNLYFTGRSGTRVKIRGLSVDLAEVEAGLRLCKSVRDAAVITESHGGHQESERLVAYVVTGPDVERVPKHIRLELAEKLPIYMLPSEYIFLDVLPLTATGKVDRKALARMGSPSGERKDDIQPPLDELEQQIAAIYQKVLKYSPAGRHDDFFVMGGNSLAYMELKSLLAGLFGHPVGDIFGDATVAGVAQANRHLLSRPPQDKQLMPVLVPLTESGSGPILFLVHGRLGQAFVSRQFLDAVGGDQPVYAFQARGVDGIQAPNETVEAMAQDYVAALRQVQPHGPYFIGALCAGGYVAIEMARLLQGNGEQVFTLLLIDMSLPNYSAQSARNSNQILPDRILQRSAAGNIDFDLDDPMRWKGADAVEKNFGNALTRYRPTPYDGPVFMITSSDRLRSGNGWGNPSTFNKVFSGKVDFFEAGKSHDQIFDVQNERFASILRHCVEFVRSGRPDTDNRAFDPPESIASATEPASLAARISVNRQIPRRRPPKWF